jgi:hypothetical protein
MTEGSETDPKARIAELTRRRNEIDAEIGRIRDGDIPLLNDTALKDRFQQFLQLARNGWKRWFVMIRADRLLDSISHDVFRVISTVSLISAFFLLSGEIMSISHFFRNRSTTYSVL